MIFSVGTEAELAEAIAGLEAPVVLRGGGTRPVGRSWAQDVLDLSGLSGVVEYEPGALTLWRRPARHWSRSSSCWPKKTNGWRLNPWTTGVCWAQPVRRRLAGCLPPM